MPLLQIAIVSCSIVVAKKFKMNVKVKGVILCVFIGFMCCECSFANRVHWRQKRYHSKDHNQQCSASYNEHICKQEYIQTRARYFLSCNHTFSSDRDLLSEYPCTRHENGTVCEELFVRYFSGNSFDRSFDYYTYNPDSTNRSCYDTECSQECIMILQQLKNTLGVLFS